MLIATFAALAAVPLLVWGSANGLIRDQGSPSWSGQPVEFKKWKEMSILLLGLPLALLAWWRFGPLEAGIVEIGMAGAWSLGHLNAMGLRFAPSRDGQFESLPLVYAKLTLTGVLVTLAPAGVLVWHGHVILGAVVLLAGAFKTGCYEVMYVARGLDAPRPHAGTLAAMVHGAIAVGVTGAAMVLS